jgi:hypothetical protein
MILTFAAVASLPPVLVSLLLATVVAHVAMAWFMGLLLAMERPKIVVEIFAYSKPRRVVFTAALKIPSPAIG